MSWFNKFFNGGDTYRYTCDEALDIEFYEIKIKSMTSSIASIEIKIFWNFDSQEMYVLMPGKDMSDFERRYFYFTKENLLERDFWLECLDYYTEDRVESEYILDNLNEVFVSSNIGIDVR